MTVRALYLLERCADGVVRPVVFPPGAVLNYPSRPVSTRGLQVAVSEIVHAEVVDSEQEARQKAQRHRQGEQNGVKP